MMDMYEIRIVIALNSANIKNFVIAIVMFYNLDGREFQP